MTFFRFTSKNYLRINGKRAQSQARQFCPKKISSNFLDNFTSDNLLIISAIESQAMR